MGKIPLQDECENAVKGDADHNKEIVKSGELNELSYENWIV